MQSVLTYATAGTDTINLTRAQYDRLNTARTWPRNDAGEEYFRLVRGLHPGEPTYTDDELFDDVAA